MNEKPRYRVVPDVGHPLTMGDQEFFISGIYDTLMYYPPLDVYWIRYYDGETKDLNMMVIKEEVARRILEVTDVPYLPRETVFEKEHNALLEILGQWVTEKVFEDDDPI